MKISYEWKQVYLHGQFINDIDNMKTANLHCPVRNEIHELKELKWIRERKTKLFVAGDHTDGPLLREDRQPL